MNERTINQTALIRNDILLFPWKYNRKTDKELLSSQVQVGLPCGHKELDYRESSFEFLKSYFHPLS